ncbi:MAG: hypothetical protein ABMA13_21705 [Chthoniobacteraceae bacterium]
MEVPLKWNMAGARYNAGLKWNGTINTNPRRMKTNAIIDFSPYTAAEFGPVAQLIHDKMTTNAATFTAPPTSMAALQTLVTTYDTKLTARASNASADVLAFHVARTGLEEALHDLGIYVNLVAKGDPMILEKSGFPSYDSTPTPLPAHPAAPENVKLRNGDGSGTVTGRCKPDRANSTNVAQITTGDPNNEAGWQQVLIFNGGKAVITGLTVGSIVWVRFATVGAGGQLGDWSDPARIVVT